MIERLKMARLAFVSVGFAAGIAVASLPPGVPQTVRKLAGLAFEPGSVQSHDRAAQVRDEGSKAPDDKQAVVSLTDEQLTEAHIDLAHHRTSTAYSDKSNHERASPLADRGVGG
jgi:hypothetical protein